MTSNSSSPEGDDIAAWRRQYLADDRLMGSYRSSDDYVDQMLWREWFAGIRRSVYAQFYWYVLVRKGRAIPSVIYRSQGFE